MELGLRGRKALITGASRGIGRACAEVLAEEGCDVVLVSRTAADLEAAKAKITAEHNVAVRCFPLDLSDSKSVDTLAEECPETERMTRRLRREAQAQFGDAERWRELTRGMAFGRAATPQEIARMAAFLASDRSAYTTGTIVTVDGGGTSRRGAF
jgi:NAD(P)-dependent dehydrogenase (short-subunit alcohol dehydrogenase family)